jgi:transposase
MLRQKRETGSLALKERRYGPEKLLSEKDNRWRRRQLEKESDLTIAQRHERFNQARKIEVSRATIGRAVQRLNRPLKKRVRWLKKETIGNEPGIDDG